jgi:hypothetical protein
MRNHRRQGELDWLLALLTRLKEGRHLAVARADRGPAQRVADMAADKGTRWAGRAERPRGKRGRARIPPFLEG